jgi:hypothetical protein
MTRLFPSAAWRFAALAVTLVGLGCSGSGSGDAASDSPTAEETGTQGPLPFKIGIMTGTVSQGEDEYRGAERVIARYGTASVRHVTYPDNFMTEQETMIAQVPGSIAAIERVRKLRPEITFLVDVPHEDPNQISKYADVIILPDDLRRGETIVDLAHKMGAKTFVHYSFPRHMSQELLARRKDIMAERAASLGMEFMYVNAPDPTGDQGLPGAQKFILEDVPRQVALHGTDTAFFSTNCGMQEPVIRAALDNGAIMPEQCCPSPTHGYPGALNIGIDEEHAGDMAFIRAAIKEKVTEAGQNGRMGTWPVSVGITSIEALAEIAIRGVRDGTNVADPVILKEELEKAMGGSVELVSYENTDNYYLYLMESVIF